MPQLFAPPSPREFSLVLQMAAAKIRRAPASTPSAKPVLRNKPAAHLTNPPQGDFTKRTGAAHLTHRTARRFCQTNRSRPPHPPTARRFAKRTGIAHLTHPPQGRSAKRTGRIPSRPRCSHLAFRKTNRTTNEQRATSYELRATSYEQRPTPPAAPRSRIMELDLVWPTTRHGIVGRPSGLLQVLLKRFSCHRF